MAGLEEIFADVLDLPVEKINDGLTRADTSEWDSFNHLLLISEIEKKLEIKLSIDEIEKIKSFKDLRIIIMSKK